MVSQRIPILSSSGCSGYWISYDLNEIESFIKEGERRANTIIKTLNPLKQYILEQKGIKLIPVKAHFRCLNKTKRKWKPIKNGGDLIVQLNGFIKAT